MHLNEWFGEGIFCYVEHKIVAIKERELQDICNFTY